MFGKFYVGHEVIVCKKFTKFNYANNSTCCHIENNYFVSRKCVLLYRDKDRNYFYLRDFSKCNVIDPNNLEVVTKNTTCEQCNVKKIGICECEIYKNNPIQILGVLDIQPIQSFAKTMDLDLAISLINDYNKKISDEENYVSIDDISYIDIIREIDEGIGRKKLKGIYK